MRSADRSCQRTVTDVFNALIESERAAGSGADYFAPTGKQYPVEEGWQTRHIAQVIEASAEVYPFPANLELEPPMNGLAPVSQQQLMSQCLTDGCTTEEFTRRVRAQQGLKHSH